MQSPFGKLVLFGSGETSPTGRKIHRKVLKTVSKKQNIVILETPAGFQPNSALVACDIADVFHHSLAEFTKNVSIIPARRKGSEFSPDNTTLLTPVATADYIFLGPGSPTYTVRILKNSKALTAIVERFKVGATLALSSAAAISFGEFALPVYEIYKAGADLYWEKGLNVLTEFGLPISVVTHWNNHEGGEGLDTRYCYMGEERFGRLRAMLPKEAKVLGIDEQTAIIFDFQQDIFSVEGVGSVHILQNEKTVTLEQGKTYMFDSIKKMQMIPSKKTLQNIFKHEKEVHEHIAQNDLPEVLQTLLEKRRLAKTQKDFVKADAIRQQFHENGYHIEDELDGEKIYKD
ncbi:MAG: cysteinyl-tRNA synthetase [Candidatus Levybacteria bacterium]|nr:cysteinyl-tRNA synthetase [Candidatus Levybacteria bacterium]